MFSRLPGLWRHPDFLKLWAAETISQVGTQVTLLALPLTAVLVLDATPAQMGILTAAETAPFLLVGLFAGVWVDRMRRRPVLVVSDILRGVFLLGVPAAALLDLLRIEYLYAIAFAVGVLTVFFDVAYQSYLPSLVGRQHLVEGNSKLEVSRSGAQIAGPGLAGGLVSLVTAPMAVLADALSFLASAAFLWRIRAPEPAPERHPERPSIWREIGEGLRVVLGNRLLRATAGCTATSNFFGNVIFAIFVLYVTRELDIGAGLLGLIFAAGNVGFLLGAVIAGRVPGRFGVGPTIIGASLLFSVSSILIPLASGPRIVIVLMLVAAQFVGGLGSTVYNVNQVSLRQVITPDRLLGRMNATMRFIIWGTLPLGSLLGGALGTVIGLRPTLVVGVAGGFLSVLWLWFSPLRTLREHPPAATEPPQAEEPVPAVQ